MGDTKPESIGLRNEDVKIVDPRKLQLLVASWIAGSLGLDSGIHSTLGKQEIIKAHDADCT